MSVIAPFGGKILPKTGVQLQMLELVRKQAALEPAELVLLLRTVLDKANINILLLEHDTVVDGNLDFDRHCDWVQRNRLGALVCLGDLTVTGDLLMCDLEKFTPFVFVAGTLRARNLVKGLPPLFVLGDSLLAGYYLGTGNDGLLRIGGDLDAAGYVFRCRDGGGVRGHVVAGKVSAPSFDYREWDLPLSALRAAFVPEVIARDGLCESTILSRQRAGLPVWRDASAPPSTELTPGLAAPLPEIKPVDPRPLATVLDAADAQVALADLISAAIPFDPGQLSCPEHFLEFVRHTLVGKTNAKVLLLPAGTRLAGDLVLDWDSDWLKGESCVAIACSGDLHVEGDILNRNLNGGPSLFVVGSLYTDNLIKGGASVVVCGDVHAKGIIVAEYNDGVVRIGGEVHAQALVILDHDFYVSGSTLAPIVDEDAFGDLRDVLVQEVFEGEREVWPSAERLWAQQRAGLPLFQPDFDPGRAIAFEE